MPCISRPKANHFLIRVSPGIKAKALNYLETRWVALWRKFGIRSHSAMSTMVFTVSLTRTAPRVFYSNHWRRGQGGISWTDKPSEHKISPRWLHVAFLSQRHSPVIPNDFINEMTFIHKEGVFAPDCHQRTISTFSIVTTAKLPLFFADGDYTNTRLAYRNQYNGRYPLQKKPWEIIYRVQCSDNRFPRPSAPTNAANKPPWIMTSMIHCVTPAMSWAIAAAVQTLYNNFDFGQPTL